jgi:ribonuclease HI
MSTKTKFYVVWKGRQTGIFTDWKTCEAQVKGFAGAQYKAFETRQEAERAFAGEYAACAGKPASSQRWLFAPHPPIADSYVVDAACSGVPGPVEWRGVHLASGKEIFHQGPFPNGTNNIGEFLAIVHALALLEREHLSLPVYSDSLTAIAWVEAGKCQTDLLPDEQNAPLFDLIARAEAWLAEHPRHNPVLKWDTEAWGENPADFHRK